MIGHCYSQSQYDNCVYHRKFSDGPHDISLINESKAQLKSEFEMKHLGVAKKTLSIEIHRDCQA